MLNETVNTILGMPFLESTNPIINWKTKLIKIKYKGKLFTIPTVQDSVPEKLVSPPKLPSCTVISKNSFAELVINSSEPLETDD